MASLHKDMKDFRDNLGGPTIWHCIYSYHEKTSLANVHTAHIQGGIRVNILNTTGHVIYALLGLQDTFINSEDIT